LTAPVAIQVRARLFAVQRELAGIREVVLSLPQDATVDDAWAAIVAKYPALAPGRAYLRFAVNGQYADSSATLSDGDEIAFIPPVSGGAGRRILELRDEPLARTILADLAAGLATPADGAVVGFLGVTRESPGTPAPGQEAEAARHTGRRVESLSYESHEAMALRTLETIADEIEARFGVERLAIVHRTGDVPLGEASVAIVAVAPHRDAAFDAARYAIDETKARAPIWKAERFADGHLWIGEPARTAPKPNG
jgi:molybdopterin synthase catalytic subunit